MTKLKNLKPAPPEKFSKKKCNNELSAFHKKYFELQHVFYADGHIAKEERHQRSDLINGLEQHLELSDTLVLS